MFEAMMARVRQLTVSVEALAALGAELKLRQDQLEGDPQLRTLLRQAVRAVDARWLEHGDANEAAAALALIQTVFRQSLDMLEKPARPPGWSFEDPQVLETQGQLSRIVVRGIAALATDRPELAAALRRPGVLLDVGTGVGWLAIEAARTWPALRIVGLDPFEPALVLARRNRAQSEVAERIEFRLQRVEQLEETATVNLAWLPGPFIAREALDQALASVQRALTPGGWLIFGLAGAPEDPLEDALVKLRITRGGGHPWTPGEVEERLRRHDFTEIEGFSPRIPVRFVIGRRAVSARRLRQLPAGRCSDSNGQRCCAPERLGTFLLSDTRLTASWQMICHGAARATSGSRAGQPSARAPSRPGALRPDDMRRPSSASSPPRCTTQPALP